ncbi:unnamed protein product, partial [Mesorhabditis belari]|uniref:Uncharacterized protein n=1 Tax=Mesorhabditis belari TaxID=2138241 RepID=A0AAF3EPC3_9BILA
MINNAAKKLNDGFPRFPPCKSQNSLFFNSCVTKLPSWALKVSSFVTSFLKQLISDLGKVSVNQQFSLLIRNNLNKFASDLTVIPKEAGDF